MARAKKTAAATTTASSTAPKTRGIDLQEVEARVTALDKAKRRSYDIFDIEQRVYNLEKNGGGGGTSSTLEVIQDTVTDLSNLSIQVSASSSSGQYTPEYGFGDYSTFNKMWIANTAVSYYQIEKSDPFSLVFMNWLSGDPNRYATPVSVECSDNGTTFEEVTVLKKNNNFFITDGEKKAKFWRINFSTTDSPTYYAGFNNAFIVGR